MKSGIKKTMRVATTFTGAAACAAAFTPAAMAGTTGTAHQIKIDGKVIALPLHGVTRIVPGHDGARPDGVISGSIKVASCANTPHWMHLANGTSSICFGFRGKLSFSGAYIHNSHECGGNNHGYLESLNGARWGYNTGTFYTKPGVENQGYVRNSGWAGNDTCPRYH